MPTWLGGEVRARKERVQKKPEPDYASHCTLLRAAARRGRATSSGRRGFVASAGGLINYTCPLSG